MVGSAYEISKNKKIGKARRRGKNEMQRILQRSAAPYAKCVAVAAAATRTRQQRNETRCRCRCRRRRKSAQKTQCKKQKRKQKKNANAKVQLRKCAGVCVCVCVRRRQANILYRQAATTPSQSPHSVTPHSLLALPISICICAAFAFACTFRLLAFREMLRATKGETKCKTHMRIIEFYYIVWRGTHTHTAAALSPQCARV